MSVLAVSCLWFYSPQLRKGLQSCLNKLSIFCYANGLIVNLKKTNIIIFSKSGRNVRQSFCLIMLKLRKLSYINISYFRRLVRFHTARMIYIKEG